MHCAAETHRRTPREKKLRLGWLEETIAPGQGSLMNRSSIRRMLDRGRKAGLSTSDLYRALTARPAIAGDAGPGQTDCNGYVSQVNANGQRTFDAQRRRD